MSQSEHTELRTLPERLRYAMKKRNIVQEGLAELAGCSQGAIQKILSGKTQKSKFLPDIARALNADIDWLALGINPPDETDPLPHQKQPRDGGPPDLTLLSPWDDDTPLDHDEVELPIYKEVELQSGQGRAAVQVAEGRKVRFSRRTLRAAGVDPACAACAKNVGNSNAPLILDGATLGIDKGMTRIIDGQLYALDHDGLLRIKFIYRQPGGGLRLRSYNRSEYADEDYSFDQIMEQRLHILGRVFWWSTLNPINTSLLNQFIT